LSELRALAGLFGEVDTLVFLAVAVVVGYVSLTRRGRPLTMSRGMDVALSTILFIMLGVRYATLTVLTLAFPGTMMVGAGPALAPLFAGLDAAGAAVGFGTHRAGSVGARALGAGVLAGLTLVDALVATFVLEQSVVGRLDTALSVAIAAGACVCAAYFWTYRTAIPDPLGSDKRPFDY